MIEVLGAVSAYTHPPEVCSARTALVRGMSHMLLDYKIELGRNVLHNRLTHIYIQSCLLLMITIGLSIQNLSTLTSKSSSRSQAEVLSTLDFRHLELSPFTGGTGLKNREYSAYKNSTTVLLALPIISYFIINMTAV